MALKQCWDSVKVTPAHAASDIPLLAFHRLSLQILYRTKTVVDEAPCTTTSCTPCPFPLYLQDFHRHLGRIWALAAGLGLFWAVV